MGLSGALLWWEEWQLRILVLASLFVQWLLFLFAGFRKYAIPSWFRFIIWLADLGSDALAIYALATLFNRQSRQDCNSGQGSSILEVIWAPVLLMHLGGQDLITAYNIEDNELWTRHIVTAVSQITVAIYVFCKSWPGGDRRLLQAAILFFVLGVLKCLEKPWALKSASINSLVSPSIPAPVRIANRKGGIDSLEDYVQAVRAFVQVNHRCQTQELDAADNRLPDQAQGEEDAVHLEAHKRLPDQVQGEDDVVDLEAVKRLPDQVQGEDDSVDLETDLQPQTSSTWRSCPNQIKETIRSLRKKLMENSRSQVDDNNVDLEAYKLFVDLASPYPDRLDNLKSFWVLDEKQAYGVLKDRLFSTFSLLYTKEKMRIVFEENSEPEPSFLPIFSGLLRISTAVFPFAAIALFHKSHKDAYGDNDVKVTYALFCCTAVLESYSGLIFELLVKSSSSDVGGKSMRTIALQWQSAQKIGALCKHAKEKVMQWQWVKKMVALYEHAKEKVMQWQWVKKMVALHEWAEAMVPYRLPIKQQRARKIDAWYTGELLDAIVRHSRIGQYALVGFFVRNKRRTKTTCILSLSYHKDFFYQHWSMKPCNSSFEIIELVHRYVKKGWEDQIKDADSYWKFNDRRGQWTLQSNRFDQGQSWSLRRPFDESVLLWHIATDFCFYYMAASARPRCATAQCIQDASGIGHHCAVWCESSPRHKRAVRCREISNYMIYLLFVKPEMLLSGTRRNLLMTANAELEKILSDDNPSLKNILKGDKPSLMDILKRNKPFLKFFTGKRPELKEIERGFIQRIIAKVDKREQVVGLTGSPPDEERFATTQYFVPDAWNLAKALLHIDDESKMWEVIEGVWVEMLCFSASRCRGYLHAKSLGTGGELLTYVLLLLSQMGMETLPERLQRMELSSGERNDGTLPSTSQIHEMEYPTRFRRSRSHEEAASTAAAHTSTTQRYRNTC